MPSRRTSWPGSPASSRTSMGADQDSIEWRSLGAAKPSRRPCSSPANPGYVLEEPEQSLSCAAELQDFVEDQADRPPDEAHRRADDEFAAAGLLVTAALCLRAGRRALKLCYGLTDCSGGEFDLGAERRALPPFVHGFGNLRVRPTVGQHHAPPNLPGFPGALTPACPVEMVYMVFLYSVYL